MKKIVYVRNVPIGNGKITIQSMTNTLSSDFSATASQIKRLADAGADMVRVSLPDVQSAELVKEYVKLNVPIIGDIHFDYNLALRAIDNGIDKIRINPANMSKDGLKAVVKAAVERNIPIRVGVNKGSFKERLSPNELALKAVDCAKSIEDNGSADIILAVKSSDVKETVLAYRELSKMTDYPLHIGLTEAGTPNMGIIKSSVAIGSLLLDGIGDTIRVSLSTDPIEEIFAAKKILRSVGEDKSYVEVIACPTCSRTCIDVCGIASRIEKVTENIHKSVKIAVMGCVVNGIGESKDADFGVAGGKDKSSLISGGKIIGTVNNGDIEKVLMKMLEERL